MVNVVFIWGGWLYSNAWSIYVLSLSLSLYGMFVCGKLIML